MRAAQATGAAVNFALSMPPVPASRDWAGTRIYVVSEGTRLREAMPASPEAFRYLARYLDEDGVPAADEPLWRMRRGEPRACRTGRGGACCSFAAR